MADNLPGSNAAPAIEHRKLRPYSGNARLSGFSNMFNKEMGDWFQTRRWIVQTILWVALLNGFLAFILFVVPEINRSQGDTTSMGDLMVLGVSFLLNFAVIAGSIGTLILAQDEVVGEKQTGTAAWILSKPIARMSFILSKLAANGLGILIFILLIPGLIGIVEISAAAGKLVAIPGYFLGLGVVYLGLLFYLTFSLMLGTLFSGRGPVIGIGLGLLFSGSIVISFVPDIAYFLPVDFQNIAPQVALGQTLSQVAQIEIAATAAWCIVFMLVALWRFERQEL
jgi:ABC-2 type transport system permease protein